MSKNVFKFIFILCVACIDLKAGQNVLPDKYFDIDMRKISYDDIVIKLKEKKAKFEDTYVYGDRIIIADTFVGSSIEKKYISRVVYYLRGLDDLYMEIEIEIPMKYYFEFRQNFSDTMGNSFITSSNGNYRWVYNKNEDSFYQFVVIKKEALIFHESVREDLKSRKNMFYILMRGKSRLPEKKLYIHPVD
ncbi:MAG TPA: hypothetical protein PLH15_05200 [Spirochaetota bacterium]|nr:hypothetical protein [Spirochaetota bacterium]HQO23414.1 hypothetical protein [Spirochaetota bacterium]HQQ23217.1 hypothetical protein [Spirochaetota bacterium]